MLGALTEKMQGLFSSLAGKKTLTEENITDTVRKVRLALLEADVNYKVAKSLVMRIKEKALGDEVLKSVSPGEQFIKIVHDELVLLMGGQEVLLDISKRPSVIMMCGLQGSGKTTQCVKLARYLQKEKLAQKVLIAACDLQRPAAIAQLQTFAAKIDVPVYTDPEQTDPVAIATGALKRAKAEDFDVLILDTAGRLHVDEELMQQLQAIQAAVNPSEVLFVANAATGQDAVTVAAEFNRRVEITGSILTMLDSNARGGAAISIREVTGKPLKFEGIGEGVDAIQVFHPKSMADRILGMGDTINLVRKAKEHIDENQAKEMEKKIRTATFTYDDYLQQMSALKKMGSLKSLLGMVPGMSMLKNVEIDEKEFSRVEAMIQSMTPDERRLVTELSVHRRKRVARGAGIDIDRVNRMVKTFKRMREIFKNKSNMKRTGGMPWQ